MRAPSDAVNAPPLRYGSVCSGIEAATVAWHPLGWAPAWFAEIEPFPCAVLAHHYPDVPNLGDMTTIQRRLLVGEVDAPDILCGGTPCQAFSVAGKRESLADARGNLSLTFCEIANAVDDVRAADGDDACVVVWENVPGVLSTSDNAFGCFLGALAGADCELQPAGKRWADAGIVLGPRRAVAWRVLDAQYFGLAQRRRRVFVVASARDGFDPGAVLLEFDGVRRDSAPRREAQQSPAGTLAGGARKCGGYSTDDIPLAFGGNNTSGPIDVATARNACGSGSGRMDFESETFITLTLRGEYFDASEDGTGRGTPLVPVAFSCKDHGADASADVAPTLRAMGHDDSHANGGGQVAVAFHHNAQAAQLPGLERDTSVSDSLTCSQQAAVALGFIPKAPPNSYSMGEREEQSPTVTTHMNGQGVQQAMSVRRLTPRECERLQGFPDDYTLIPWRKKPASECPDGPRYKALGNSWAVPCVRWIGRRIQVVLS